MSCFFLQSGLWVRKSCCRFPKPKSSVSRPSSSTCRLLLGLKTLHYVQTSKVGKTLPFLVPAGLWVEAAAFFVQYSWAPGFIGPTYWCCFLQGIPFQGWVAWLGVMGGKISIFTLRLMGDLWGHAGCFRYGGHTGISSWWGMLLVIGCCLCQTAVLHSLLDCQCWRGGSFDFFSSDWYSFDVERFFRSASSGW